jgi:hypothetical protein
MIQVPDTTMHNSVQESIFKEIDDKGYILMHDISEEIHAEIFKLIENGTLIQLNNLPATAKFMNASYKATYADDRFKLAIYHNDNSHSSWVVKTDG